MFGMLAAIREKSVKTYPVKKVRRGFFSCCYGINRGV